MTSKLAALDEQLSRAIGDLRSYTALVVIGAGLSAGRYPMTAQSPPLVWHAIETAPEALSDLRQRLNHTRGSAKQLLTLPDVSENLGWELLRAHPSAMEAFKKAFVAHDADADPSEAHYALARLIHEQRIISVVSYNWDTSLERAYEQLYGVALPTGILFKPHGDAADPGGAWVLPDEDGQVTEDVLARVRTLSDQPHVLTIVGYSGSDAAVVAALLEPLEQKWPVVRIGPSTTGADAVSTNADRALRTIADAIAPQETLRGWRYVNFSRSRGFEAALRGERLGPADVDACPEFPAAARLANRLSSSRFATVSGQSGTGKSVTAFHAGRRMNRVGWQVVALTRPGVASHDDVATFQRLVGPVLAVVDDAQAISEDVRAGFEYAVDHDHAVLLVSTQRLEARDDELLTLTQGAQILHDYCTANLETVGPLLMELDDRVRWSHGFETPPRRLTTAQRTTTEPWLYMFVASGGDRRIIGQLDQLVDAVDPALVLGMICIAQMTSRDAGMTMIELTNMLVAHCAERFVRNGSFDAMLLDKVLRDLTSRRLVREHDGRIRAAHVRVADRALLDLGQRDNGLIGPGVRRAVRAALLDEQQEPAGKFWLLRVFEHSDAYRGHRAHDLVDAEVSAALVAQARNAAPGPERGVSLNLIWSSEWLHLLDDGSARLLADMLIGWFPSLVEQELNGLHWSLSGLRSHHKSEFHRVQNSITPGVLAGRFSNTVSRTAAMEWANVITQFRQVENREELVKWDTEFAARVDGNRIAAALSQRGPQSHPLEIYELIDALAGLAPAAADLIMRACADELRETFETDLADATANFSNWVFGSMMYVAWIADAPSPSTHPSADTDRAAAREGASPEILALSVTTLDIMRSVDWHKAARSLEKTTKIYELDNFELMLAWLGYLSSEITDRIAESISKDWLRSRAVEERANGSSSRRFYLTSSLLNTLSHGPSGHAIVKEYLEEHPDELAPFPAILVASQPELAARFINEGKAIEVPGHTGIDWDDANEALQAVVAVDPPAATRWLRDMRRSMIDGMNYEHLDIEGFADFALTADGLDPVVLDSAFEEIDASAVEHIWRNLLDRKPEDARALLMRASRTDTSIGQLSAHIIAEISPDTTANDSEPATSKM